MTEVKAEAGIVVVGGGIAGVEIATSLGRLHRNGAPRVSLVDKDSAHVWKPMLHTIAAGTRDLASQQAPYIALARDAGFIFQPGELTGIDRSAREIELAPIKSADGRELVPARRLRYEALILALGSTANDFGTPGVKTHCYMIDSREQADRFNQEVRLRMLQCLAGGTVLSIVIVGGGATGVELAAELVQLTEAAVGYGADGLASHVKISLVESSPRLLAAFPEAISAAAQARLESLGVKVRTHTRVKEARAESLLLESGETFACSLAVWAAGVKAPDVLRDIAGLETTSSGQLVITPTLQTTRDPYIYAVGDCASLKLPGRERALPPTAQVAHQQAQYLVHHLGRARRDAPAAFRYKDFGSLVSLGRYDGFGSLGRIGVFKGGFIRGRVAQISHSMLYRAHQARLYGFWRGALLWLVDMINRRVRPSIRLD